jgi:DNA segregation ATPase FtsK/SpoIIIE, S-DNA-T family
MTLQSAVNFLLLEHIMSADDRLETSDSIIPEGMKRFARRRSLELVGLGLYAVIGTCALALASWSAHDPSFNNATDGAAHNWLGSSGAIIADQLMQMFGIAVIGFLLIPLAWAGRLVSHQWRGSIFSSLASWLGASCLLAAMLSSLPSTQLWSLSSGMGGQIGDVASTMLAKILSLGLKGSFAWSVVFMACAVSAVMLSMKALAMSITDTLERLGLMSEQASAVMAFCAEVKDVCVLLLAKARAKIRMPTLWTRKKPVAKRASTKRPVLPLAPVEEEDGVLQPDVEEDAESLVDFGLEDDDLSEQDEEIEDEAEVMQVTKGKAFVKPRRKPEDFELPSLDYLAEAKRLAKGPEVSEEQLAENAQQLVSVLEDFGVKGKILKVRPGPVVTLYELEPAPGIKSSRVIGLADDIARSMSAISARVAVVQGRNAIGIELPNAKRETVYLREMFAAETFIESQQSLCVALGKNIGGDPIFADLARMPHLLIAGTTGSGKSVGINTLILSLLYRLPPERCRLIMIDPKMLELSVYEGIPHLLAPVVTDPKKAVVALKWAVREMEDRYKKMSKIGVRNVDGYNAKVQQLIDKGEKLTRTVQTGFDADTGKPIFESEEMETKPMPFIVVIIDEMADLMMVAGKDIEGAVQRLAQMARAAGIHVVMATQRPSVDVITGTIKANFPTRISFQVTSKIDSRTILGEQGAEQLLGQGDMLYMAGGGRISRLHGPFVSDGEVETIVKHLKAQGQPEYVDAVTEDLEEDGGDPAAMLGEGGGSGDDLYDQAVAVVLRDKKVSTSYIQRRLQVGYNKAASLIERMENEGLISAANATGKREILVPGDSSRL